MARSAHDPICNVCTGGRLAAVAAILCAAQQGAQAQSITFYEKVNFEGRSVTYEGEAGNVRAPFIINSARMSGGVWELCSKAGFKGACLTIEDDLQSVKKAFGFFAKVNSARPAADAQVARAGAAPSPATSVVAPDDSRAPDARPTVDPRSVPLVGQGYAGVSARFVPRPLSSGKALPADLPSATTYCGQIGLPHVLHLGADKDGAAIDLLCGAGPPRDAK